MNEKEEQTQVENESLLATDIKDIATISEHKGKKVWIAEILGADKQYVFERRFLGRKHSTSKAYMILDAEEDLESLNEGAVVERVTASWTHKYYSYYKKVKNNKFIFITSATDYVDKDTKKQVLAALKS